MSKLVVPRPIKDIKGLLAQLVQNQLDILEALKAFAPEVEITPPPAEVRHVVTQERVLERIAPELLVRIAKEVVRLQTPLVIRHYDPVTSSNVGEAKELVLEGSAVWLMIDNTDVANNIKVSFDERKHYKTIVSGANLFLALYMVPENLRTFWFKSDDAADVAFEVILGEI